MTIRFTCDKCGSVLKIKDELAGTDGKCPKCKTRFVVPQPAADEPAAETVPSEPVSPEATEMVVPPAPEPVSVPETKAPETTSPTKVDPPAKGLAKPAAKSPEKPAPKAPSKPAADDDFDPVSFLMEGPKKKPSLEPEPAAPSPMAGGGAPRGGGGGRGFSLDDDEDSTAEPPMDTPAPTRKWGAKKEISAAAAAERSMGGSTGAAKDLLARSMEESRVRASEMPEEAPRFNFDFAGFFREVGVKGIGSVAGVILAGVGLYWIMSNMMGTKVKLPDLGYVSGTVTLKGKPVSGIKVYFSPLVREIPGARNKEIARDSTGVTDAEGNFTLYYLPEVEGVAVGPNRVWMEAIDPSIPIPAGYGLASDHKVDVTRGNNPPQKIDL